MERMHDALKNHPHTWSKSPLLLSLAAGTAGFALNGIGLPVFGGTEIVFGGCATLMVVYVLGPAWGGFATALAFSRTWLTWGHPWGMLCFTLEAVVVGLLKHRRQLGVPGATGVYWLLLGIPLAAVTVVGLTAMPFPYNWAVVLKYPANSVFVMMLVLPVLHSRRFRQRAGLALDRESDTPLQIVLFRRLGLIIALSIAVLGLFVGQMFDRALRGQSTEELVADGREFALVLESHLDRYHRVLRLLAASDPTNPDDRGTPEDHLDELRRHYPGFLTLLRTDEQGLIMAASPAINAEGQPMAGHGLSVADREYFRQPMATGRPFVSGVFRGRGFGGDLIVAMSAPVLEGSGRPVGVLEGSLNLSRLIEDLGQLGQLAGRTMVIVDRNQRVVASHGRLSWEPLHDFSTEAFNVAGQSSGTDSFFFNLPDGGGFERFVATRHRVPGFGWKVYLAEPVWKSQRIIAGFYLTTTLAAGVALGLALLLARGTATEITAPLQQLVASVRGLARQEVGVAAPAASHAARELTELGHELHGAALTLSRTNHDLASTMRERDQSHAQLRQVLLHLEEKVHERTSELEEARRSAESANAAKSEFLASMSHELRTPLNVIVGMSELIGEQTLGPLNARQAEGLQNVNESGRHLLDLINDILDLSKIEAGMLELDFQPVELAGFSQACLRFVRETARQKDIGLTTSLPPGDLTFHADERRLKQILVNLLANAVKFTPSGGTVGLRLIVPAGGSTLRFEVHDTGIGIAPENFEKVFQPFKQIDSSLSRQYSGTGLGLALVRRMTELHGGTVELQSRLGQGSCFSVVLPLRGSATAPRPPTIPAVGDRPAPPAIPAIPFPRLLIAEDNEANIAVYAGYFRTRGTEFILARNGQEAIDLALAERPGLILMDVHMPVMDGLEAMRRLRADPRTEHIPIIAVTALAMEQDRRRCLEAGATAYLSKPINLRELGRLITRVASHAAPP